MKWPLLGFTAIIYGYCETLNLQVQSSTQVQVRPEVVTNDFRLLGLSALSLEQPLTRTRDT